MENLNFWGEKFNFLSVLETLSARISILSGSEFLTAFSEVESIDFSLDFSLPPFNITGFFDCLASSVSVFLPCGLPRFLHGDAGVPI